MNEHPTALRSISTRGIKTPASPIRKLAPLAAAAVKRGVSVYPLNIGQPDIESPQEFFDGLRAYRQQVVAYEQSKGSDYLCSAWSNYMNRTLGLATVPENFLITSGASEGLLYSFMVACDPGEEILAFDPTYANYLSFAGSAGVRIVAVPTELATGFGLPSDEVIEARVTPRTRAIILCNPNNPTGTVYSREELLRVIAICERRDLFLIADETYREFVYDDRSFLSVYHLAPDNPRIIIIDSLSKRFSLCGARVGALITANRDFFEAILRFAQARLSAPSAEQYAAAYMLERIGDDFTSTVRSEYQLRRDALYTALTAIKGVKTFKPQGAFYVVAHLPVDDAEDFARYLLSDFSFEGATTFVAPAAGFYIEPGRGKQEVRIAYVLERQKILSAVRCLEEGLNAYHR